MGFFPQAEEGELFGDMALALRAARSFCGIIRNQTICQNSCRLGLKEGESEGLMKGEIQSD